MPRSPNALTVPATSSRSGARLRRSGRLARVAAGAADPDHRLRPREQLGQPGQAGAASRMGVHGGGSRLVRRGGHDHHLGFAGLRRSRRMRGWRRRPCKRAAESVMMRSTPSRPRSRPHPGTRFAAEVDDVSREQQEPGVEDQITARLPAEVQLAAGGIGRSTGAMERNPTARRISPCRCRRQRSARVRRQAQFLEMTADPAAKAAWIALGDGNQNDIVAESDPANRKLGAGGSRFLFPYHRSSSHPDR